MNATAKIVRLDAANNRELCRLRSTYNLTISKIEAATGGSHTLVSAWLSDPASPTFRPMRSNLLRLLKLELGLAFPKYRHLVSDAKRLREQIQGG